MLGQRRIVYALTGFLALCTSRFAVVQGESPCLLLEDAHSMVVTVQPSRPYRPVDLNSNPPPQKPTTKLAVPRCIRMEQLLPVKIEEQISLSTSFNYENLKYPCNVAPPMDDLAHTSPKVPPDFKLTLLGSS